MPKQDIRLVKDDRRQLDMILKQVGVFKRSYVKVGVLEGTKEDVVYRDKNGRKKRTGKSIMMAMIAAVHEYGSPKRGVPERSFIRGWVDGDKAVINKFILSLLRKVEDGKLYAEQALKLLGNYGVAGIRHKITTGPFQALKEATIKRKKSSKPLLDTGQLRGGIHYKVEKR